MSIKSRLKKWLEIPDFKPDINEDELVKTIIEKSSNEIYEKAKEEYRFNANILKSFTEIKCDGCGASFITYPFGGGYYRNVGDGKYYHSRQCLEENE